MSKLTVSGYARVRGVSHTAVQKAINTGRLVNSITRDEKGRVQIDPVVAQLEWKLNTDDSMAHNVKNKPAAPPPVQPFSKALDAPIPTADAMASGSTTRSSSREIKEAYQARLAKLDYEERIGKLVDAAAVKAEAFKLARGVRDSLLNIPDRVAAEFAGLTVPAVIHARLIEELRNALSALQE